MLVKYVKLMSVIMSIECIKCHSLKTGKHVMYMRWCFVRKKNTGLKASFHVARCLLWASWGKGWDGQPITGL